jgi:hypothetical protein
MISIRTGRIAAVAAAATLLLATAAAVAAAPTPVASLTASISPSKIPKVGMPITLTFNTKFAQPAGGKFKLQKLVFKFPHGAAVNGKLFPSCDANKLARAHGQLSVCPKGSKIGGGKAVGTAIDIGVTSSGIVTIFNGPGGKSVTLNVNIVTPALINVTMKVPLQKTSGKYGYITTVPLPDSLQTILDGPIVVRSINTKIGATATIKGKKRGYIESAITCPKSAKLPFHGDFFFTDDSTTPATPATTSADTTIKCTK